MQHDSRFPRKQVAVLDDYQHAALASADWTPVQQRADVSVFSDHPESEDALIERLKPFDAICVMRERTPLTAERLARLPNLKLIASTGPANASIDSAAAAAHGIVVRHTSGRGNGALELTWALILASARNLLGESASVRSGGWQTSVGSDLEGRTLGVMGLGRIGSRLAQVGKAFGMRVIAWSPNLTEERAQASGVAYVDKARLLRESDWLSLHLVLSDRTRGIVGAEDLAIMKPGAWLVNTSRGALVDEGALIEALERRSIAGAALDVFDTEPLPPEHAFRRLANVIATPHVGFVTQDNYRVFFEQTIESLVEFLDGNSR
ncbi:MULTISPECIES: D-2-hydroxyacid dehydrogenase family protein [Burkholderia]|uniref:D-2-hydroxyacid dehydrogenase family protein n=1 Tax=Burkholderia TaxID=32008 RepID=UPI00075E2B75|nr:MULTISPECIES: D-2-hydroxyacid dehydrogenase family protein [Burkholderia]KVM66262.1 hydroxyacid dehydrogenase [Burkholderia gladioli]NBI50755.1 D-2-hydroxyacid dehydrogenase family protein [Burkholderia sp. ISTR5]